MSRYDFQGEGNIDVAANWLMFMEFIDSHDYHHTEEASKIE